MNSVPEPRAELLPTTRVPLTNVVAARTALFPDTESVPRPSFLRILVPPPPTMGDFTVSIESAEETSNESVVVPLRVML
jgi:hypothetical protein